ncbi:single-strand binding protein family [Rhypophila decipiens]
MSAFLRSVSRATARPSARAFSSTPSNRFARITIVGNLGAAPELKASSTGREIIRYSVGTNTGSGDNQTTSWFNVVSFAEGRFRDYLLGLPKGTMVLVEGDVSTGSFAAEDGSKKPFFNIAQKSIEILRRPQQHEEGHEGN